MTTKQRLPLAEAEAIAGEVLALLEPACERIAIAGSIRRRKPDVGDVEILAVPHPGEGAQADLFGATHPAEDMLTARVKALIDDGVLALRPDARGRTSFGASNKLLTHVRTGFAVDVFSTKHENWGMALVVRTGPGEFNIRLMQRFRELGMRAHAYGGVTDAQGNEIPCPGEYMVFRLAQWQPVKPESRR